MPTASPPGLEIIGGAFVAPVEACAGPAPWSGLPALVIRLADAWHEADPSTRRAILDEVWAADGVYQDPFSDAVVGRAAMADVMGYGVAPGQYIELISWDPSDMHHGTIRMQWRHCCPSGLSLLEGTDMATVGPAGRITRVVSFWSRFVEEPAEGACDGTATASAPPTGGPVSTVASAAPAGASCAGPDVDWSALPPVAAGYGDAWNEQDPATREAILEEVWAVDGTYADPYVEGFVAGREALWEHIGGFLASADPGGYFQPRETVPSDAHHGYVRMPWIYCDVVGNIVWVGDDFMELGADGRIKRNLGFFAI